MKKAGAYALLVIVLAGLMLVIDFGRSGGQEENVCIEEPWYYSVDCNDDRTIDITDAICILEHIFMGGPPPPCIAEPPSWCDLCDDYFVNEGQEDSITTEMIVDRSVTSEKIAGGHGSGVDADTVDGIHGAAIMTSGNITIFVRPDGDDNNDGSSESTAKKTLNGAMAIVPKTVAHNVRIDLGSDTYEVPSTSYAFNTLGQNSITLSGKGTDATFIRGSDTSNTVFEVYSYRTHIYHTSIVNVRLDVSERAYFLAEHCEFSREEPAGDGGLFSIHAYSYIYCGHCVFYGKYDGHGHSCVDVSQFSKAYFNNIQAYDRHEKLSQFLVVRDQSSATVIGATVIDGFRLGIGMGGTSQGPGQGSPAQIIGGVTGQIGNPGGGITIQNCEKPIRICNHSHVIFSIHAISYNNNTNEPCIETGSSFKNSYCICP